MLVGLLLRRNSLLEHVIEGKGEENICDRRQGRRRKQLLDGFKETKGYCKLKEG